MAGPTCGLPMPQQSPLAQEAARRNLAAIRAGTMDPAAGSSWLELVELVGVTLRGLDLSGALLDWVIIRDCVVEDCVLDGAHGYRLGIARILSRYPSVGFRSVPTCGDTSARPARTLTATTRRISRRPLCAWFPWRHERQRAQSPGDPRDHLRRAGPPRAGRVLGSAAGARDPAWRHAARRIGTGSADSGAAGAVVPACPGGEDGEEPHPF